MRATLHTTNKLFSFVFVLISTRAYRVCRVLYVASFLSADRRWARREYFLHMGSRMLLLISRPASLHPLLDTRCEHDRKFEIFCEFSISIFFGKPWLSTYWNEGCMNAFDLARYHFSLSALVHRFGTCYVTFFLFVFNIEIKTCETGDDEHWTKGERRMP